MRKLSAVDEAQHTCGAVEVSGNTAGGSDYFKVSLLLCPRTTLRQLQFLIQREATFVTQETTQIAQKLSQRPCWLVACLLDLVVK